MTTTNAHSRVPSSASATQGVSRSKSISKGRRSLGATELLDINPSDVLIERFTGWKAVVKQLIAYFEGVAQIESHTARELSKLANVIQVPFKPGNQFLGEGENGMQDLYQAIRDKTHLVSITHTDLGRTIDTSIVQQLQKLKADIKGHIKNIQNDTGKLAAAVAKEREHSTRLIEDLGRDIATFKNAETTGGRIGTDPYITNQTLARQLQKQVTEENLLQKSIINMQENSQKFEESIIRAVQSSWKTYDEWHARAVSARQETLLGLSTSIAALPTTQEWSTFAERSKDHLLDPKTPLRNPEAVTYPLQDDPSLAPLRTGNLERKQRFTRMWKSGYFVLTPSGFLHEYASSDPNTQGGPGSPPAFSLFLPMCTLGAPSAPNAKSWKFHIEGRKDGSGFGSGSGRRGSGGGSFMRVLSMGGGEKSQHAWSFRAKSREEMMEWWEEMRDKCERYLMASEQVDGVKVGAGRRAVRGLGYAGAGEAVEEGVEGGAESEGERTDGTDATDGTAPPTYAHAHGDEKHAYPGPEEEGYGYTVSPFVFGLNHN
ncbi:hypothetical protein BDQ12DRAFT_655045 [Crucibulum laeve]|uniref:PH domain-containing protein n=1 Tax=Crucibulum laeve TaxID=68775 RepID=A0A5C3LTW9_9AGAR|nr:hypothetical protein BDQ12DRAFT_655045 [Crucibulum laeve]